MLTDKRKKYKNIYIKKEEIARSGAKEIWLVHVYFGQLFQCYILII